MNTSKRLEGKTVIVTGGTSGIGEAVTRLFATEGAKLVLVAQRPELGRKLVAELGSEKAVFLSANIAHPDTAKRAVNLALETFGGVDILVNNAAMDFVSEILDTKLEDVRKVIDINFIGAFLMLQECALAMKDRGGSIVNVTSRNASVGVPTMGVYGAAKSALLGLTRTAAIEFAPFNIRVNAVAPGLTDTPLIRKWIQEQSAPTSFEESVVSNIPQRRMARPEEVAKTIMFLASDDASHITGASLAVDGGYTAG